MAESSTRDRLAIVVGGGPAPGINGVISSVTIEARHRGLDVIGIRDGFSHLIERDTEYRRNAEGDFEGRRVLAEFDGVHSLPRHADFVGELLLGHLPAIEAQPPNRVPDSRVHLRRPGGTTQSVWRT